MGEKEFPENWIEIQLLELLEKFETGRRPKGGVQGILQGIPSLGGEHLNDNGGFKFEKIKYVPLEFAEKLGRGKINQDDILIVKDGATTGKVSYVKKSFPFKLAYVNEHLFLCRPHTLINSKYIFHFLYSIEGNNRIMENFTGTAQGGINRKFASNTLIPLPPRPEQDRIVAKVDTLMAQVETMQKSLERIPQLLKDFRQQVLNQAVTGKLTEEWREKNVLEEWRTVPLIELIKAKPRNGFSPRGVDYPTNVKSLSLGATTSGKFDSSKVKYLDILRPSPDSHLWLKHGDILIQRSNSLEYVGTAAIYTGKDDEFIYPDIMMKIQANDDVSNKYLNYSLSSTSTKEYYKINATGTAGNMPKINQSVVSNTPINKPPFKEQQEIVRRVESLFKKADAIEAKYKALKTKIETLPQAILHKAFKGELVEQLPNDGEAKELLKEIAELKKGKSIVG